MKKTLLIHHITGALLAISMHENMAKMFGEKELDSDLQKMKSLYEDFLKQVNESAEENINEVIEKMNVAMLGISIVQKERQN